jgi:endoglucanase
MKKLLLLMLLPALLSQGQRANAAPPIPRADSVPRLIQAESFNDDTGAIVVPTTDSGGGYAIDSIRTGVRVDYTLWVSFADTYKASFRVATAGPGASFLVVNDSTGVVLDTVVLPATGGPGSWQTVSVPLTLAHGYMALRILGNSSTPLALNWIDIEMPPPPPASQAATLPGMIQAENYVNMYGVATQPATDIGHGLNVGWIDLGDWMNYYIHIPSPGWYTMTWRASTPYDHALFEMDDLTDQRQLMNGWVPNTGGFQNWTMVQNQVFFPDSGAKIIQLRSTNWDIWNINWFYIQPGSAFGGAWGGPEVEAPSYAFESGVQVQETTDTANYGYNSYNVGWIDIYDWMNYYIQADSSGRYLFSFRVATPYDSASFQVLDNRANVLATVHVPNTGGLQHWGTVQVPVNLPAGRDTIWLMSTSWDIWNLHWFQFVKAADPPGVASRPAATSASVGGDPLWAASTVLWPNPVRDVFTIALNDTLTGKLVVQVVDGSGMVRQQVEREKTTGANVFTIPAGSLSPGVYFVRIMVGDRLQVRKLLKL